MQTRHFLNTDIHKIALLWRSATQGQRVFDSMTASILEDTVFGRPFFEAEGLIVVEQDLQLVGIALVGFAPNADHSGIDTKVAVISRLMVSPDEQFERVAEPILQRAIAFAAQRGAETIWYGSRFPHAPYLNGAYGGAIVPGVMEQERELHDFLVEREFVPQDQVESFQLLLANFRPLVNRQQITARRQSKIEMHSDPLPSSWYEACTFGKENCIEFAVRDRKNNQLCGNLSYWEIQPMSGMWGRKAAGMYFLKIESDLRRSGLATLMLGESFRHLQDLGFSTIEVQLPRSQVGMCALFKKLGFEHVGRSWQMQRAIGDAV